MRVAYVIASQTGGDICDSTFGVIAAASNYNLPVYLLCFNKISSDCLDKFRHCRGLTKIINIKNSKLENLLPEYLSFVVKDVVSDNAATVMMSANTQGRNTLPRLAALLDCEMISNVDKIAAGAAEIRHRIYAGDIYENLTLDSQRYVMTVYPSSFRIPERAPDCCPYEVLEIKDMPDFNITYLGMATPKTGQPDLTTAKTVMAGGRALASKDNFKRLESFANRIGAAVGATRAAVDAGYVPNCYQVGQTGQVIAPNLYFAFGVSGSIQHISGICESKVIVAVNTDPEADIFKVADYGLVMDWDHALTELEKIFA